MYIILWILFAVSVPVFYLFGFIQFIRWISHYFGVKGENKPLSRKLFLKEIIDELVKIAARSSGKSLNQQIIDYKNEYFSLASSELPLEVKQDTASSVPGTLSFIPANIPGEESAPSAGNTLKEEIKRDIKTDWENWYSDNSINLLLYLGAFLIVASASIYVGFQWSVIGGISKAVLFTLLTLAFFSFGVWFYNLPKIKKAGATFLAIGSLLIPFCGLSWYKFVFQPQGFAFGYTWVLTSLIALFTYIYMASSLRHRFYTYITGFSGFSLVMAFINVSDLDKQYYVLGGIFVSFILLLISKFFSFGDKNGDEIFLRPLSITANISLPAALFMSIYFAYSGENYYSWQFASSFLLASGYYITVYSFEKNINYVLLSGLFFPFSSFLFSMWLNVASENIYLLLLLIGYLYSVIHEHYRKSYVPESKIIINLSYGLVFLPFLIVAYPGMFSSSNSVAPVLIRFLTALYCFINYYFQKKEAFPALGILSTFIAVIGLGNFLHLDKLITYYLLEITLLLFLFAGYILKQTGRQLYESSLALILTLSIVIIPSVSLTLPENSFSRCYFSFLTAIYGWFIFYLQKKDTYLYLGFSTFALFVYFLFFDLWHPDKVRYLAGAVYLVIFLLLYLGHLIRKNPVQKYSALLYCSFGYGLLAFLFTINNPGYFLILNFTLAVIFLDIASRLTENRFIYLSNLSILLAVLSVLQLIGVSPSSYPLFFTIIAAAFYLISPLVKPSLAPYYKKTGLSTAGISVWTLVVCGWLVIPVDNLLSGRETIYYGLTKEIENNSLLAAYLGSILYFAHAAKIKQEAFWYFAAGFGTVNLLWQVHILDFTETQLYTIPIALYCFGIAYGQKYFLRKEAQIFFEIIGYFFLLIPVCLQSFGYEGYRYALLMGIEGIIILSLGINFINKRMVILGITALVIAIFSQTYDFLFSLPRWVITAVIGLAFLGAAIYLLQKRGDNTFGKINS